MKQPARTDVKQWGTSASLTLGHGRRDSASRIFELGSGAIVCQAEKELLLNLSAYGMIP
jgi:hypothetical protein